MERRTVLGALTAASLSVRLEDAFAVFARAQNTAQTGAPVAAHSPFETSQVEVSGNTVFVRRYGTGPAILMVHGFPRTSLMWRSLAPKLADTHTVICVDLRAYGRTGIPPSTPDHFPYSKRAMAQELVEVMVTLGFPTFTLIGHDRGGRVSYRLALDHPKNVERLAVFDVIPILEAWSRSDARSAQTYWPWILLAQKESLPERYLLGARPRPPSITLSAMVPSAQIFSKNTFQPIAIRPAFMESVRNIELRRRSMSSTTVSTRKRPSVSNVRCSIYGPSVARSTLSMQKMAVHWAFGGNGLRTRKGRR
jgi:pimeloyl-ACP methyl ester carboxylesterase